MSVRENFERIQGSAAMVSRSEDTHSWRNITVAVDVVEDVVIKPLRWDIAARMRLSGKGSMKSMFQE